MRIIILLISSIILFSCNNTEKSGVGIIDRDLLEKEQIVKFDFQKLVGKWVDTNEKNTFTEEWILDEEKNLIGKGIEILKKDTVTIEDLFITFENGKSSFGAKIMDLNTDKIVWFNEIENSLDKIVFENKTNDFPQKIQYQLISDTEIKVLLEGSVNDSLINYKFTFQRK